MTPFIAAWRREAAEERREAAWFLVRAAKGLDPARYPSDLEWRDHFIKKAKEAWKAYRHYRKETLA